MLTLIASALRIEHPTEYFTALHPPAEIRDHLSRMGVDVQRLEKLGIFRLVEANSTKITNASIEIGKQLKSPPDEMRRRFGVGDNPYVLLRYNDENSVIEFYRTRTVPRARKLERAGITFIPRGIYSPFLYKSLEMTYDGVVDIVLQDSPEGLRNLIRIRSYSMVEHDKRWCQLNVGRNFEVSLEPLPK